jgi:hypothetical protein
MTAPFQRWSRRCIRGRSSLIRFFSFLGYRGYLGCKSSGINCLLRCDVCKIFITNGLRAKYLLSMN